MENKLVWTWEWSFVVFSECGSNDSLQCNIAIQIECWEMGRKTLVGIGQCEFGEWNYSVIEMGGFAFVSEMGSWEMPERRFDWIACWLIGMRSRLGIVKVIECSTQVEYFSPWSQLWKTKSANVEVMDRNDHVLRKPFQFLHPVFKNGM
jgi:hypothetical protein